MIAGLILLLNSRQLCPVHRQMVTARLLQEQKKKIPITFENPKISDNTPEQTKCTLSGACKSQPKCSTFFRNIKIGWLKADLTKDVLFNSDFAFQHLK